MSCRPRAPSDRQHFFDEEDGSNAPPRLQGHGLASKLVLCAVIACCCGATTIVAVCVISFIASGGGAAPRPSATSETNVVFASPRHVQQRSVINRLSLLKKSKRPARGVDEASMRAIFPEWFDQSGELAHEFVLHDLVLALSFLSQDLVEGAGRLGLRPSQVSDLAYGQGTGLRPAQEN